MNQGLSIRHGDIYEGVIWRAWQIRPKWILAMQLYTFCPGESCDRLDVFPHPTWFYTPCRSFPGWVCPPLASCPPLFYPFLPFSPSSREIGGSELWSHFPRKERGHISLIQSQSKVEEGRGSFDTSLKHSWLICQTPPSKTVITDYYYLLREDINRKWRF